MAIKAITRHNISKVIALAVSAGVIGTLGGCVRQYENVGTVNDMDVRAGIYLYYQNNISYSEAYARLPEGNDGIFDKKTLIKDDNGNEVPTKAFIRDWTKELVKDHVVTEGKFSELGLTLTEEEEESYRESAEAHYTQNEKVFTKNGIGIESMTDIVINMEKQDKLFQYYYGEGGSLTPNDSDMKEFFGNEYALIKMLPISLTDVTGAPLDESGIEAAKAKGDDYAKRATLENMDSIIREYTVEQETEIARVKAEEAEKEETQSSSSDSESGSDSSSSGDSDSDSDSASESVSDESVADTDTDTDAEPVEESTPEEIGEANGILYDMQLETDPHMNELFISKEEATAPQEIMDKIFSATVGEAVTVEDSGYYYVIMRYNIVDRDDLYTEAKPVVIRQMKSEEFSGTIDSWSKEAEAKWNESAIKYYDPDKIKIGMDVDMTADDILNLV